MPITGLTMVRLNEDVTSLEAIKPILRDAKEEAEAFTGYPFHYYIQAEDQACIYIIGAWDSLEQHYDEWILSNKIKQAVGHLSSELVDLTWMFHLSFDYTEDEASAPFGAPVISITRYFAKPGKKQEIDAAISKDLVGTLDVRERESCFSHGWRLDLGYDNEEIRDIVKCAPPTDELCLFAETNDIACSSSNSDLCGSTQCTRRNAKPELFTGAETKHALRWDV